MVIKSSSLVEMFAELLAFQDYWIVVFSFVHLAPVESCDVISSELDAHDDSHHPEHCEQLTCEIRVISPFEMNLKEVIQRASYN